MRALLLCALLVCCAAVVSTPARAGESHSWQSAKRRQAAAKKRAQELLQDGYQLARAGDFANALEKFDAAYAEYPSPKILINIGTSLRHLGRHAEAADAYEEFLSEPGGDPKRHAELAELIAKIDEQVGWLEIKVREPGSEVRIDGRAVDLLARVGPLRVDPGEHSVSVQASGLPAEVKGFTIESGEHETLTFRQRKPKAAPAVVKRDEGAAQRAASYAVGGVGIAGLIVGTVLGGVALSTDAAASDQCTDAGAGTMRCDEDGIALAEDAEVQAAASSVVLGVSAALVAAGLTIYLTAPAAPEVPDDDHNASSISSVRVGCVGAGATGVSISAQF